MPRVTPQTRHPRYQDFPTITHALARAAEVRPNAPALVCLDRELTYKEYAGAVAALTGTLGERGVIGERVSYLMRNSLEMAVSLHAGMAARAEVAPLNPNYTDREIEPLVRDVDARIIVADSEFAERAQRLARMTDAAERAAPTREGSDPERSIRERAARAIKSADPSPLWLGTAFQAASREPSAPVSGAAVSSASATRFITARTRRSVASARST